MEQTTQGNEKALQVLNKSELLGRQFTVYGTAENPLFLAKEVAEMIEHSQVTRMVESVDDEEKVVNIVHTLGGDQKSWFLTEDGLYEVLMQSRKPIAKQFKKGVKAILKEIRTKGGYIPTTEQDTPEVIMAKALKYADTKIKEQQAQLAEANETIKTQNQRIQIAQGTIEEQEKQIKKDAPLADFARDVLQSSTTYTLTEISKDLDFRSVYAFTEWANRHGILYRQSDRWLPNAKYSGKGLFATRTCKYVKADNTIGTSLSTVVTEKGRASFHDFKKRLEEHERKMVERQQAEKEVAVC